MGTLYLVVASILWGVIHSWLASHGVKQALRNWFGLAFERTYRLSYNVFALASLFPVVMMLAVFPDRPLYAIPEPWVYVTTILQGLAGIALIVGVMQTGPWEFAGLAQLTTRGDPQPPALVTDGLYAYVRHPLYSAGLVFLWLTPAMTVNRLALWLIFSLYLLIGAYFEEKKLLKDFGASYADYRLRTPMFIPRLKRS